MCGSSCRRSPPSRRSPVRIEQGDGGEGSVLVVVPMQRGLRSWWLQSRSVPFRYVNVIGGFLSVTAERRDGIPTLALRNHGVDGEVLFEDILAAE